jgi:hypothetical protein
MFCVWAHRIMTVSCGHGQLATRDGWTFKAFYNSAPILHKIYKLWYEHCNILRCTEVSNRVVKSTFAHTRLQLYFQCHWGKSARNSNRLSYKFQLKNRGYTAIISPAILLKCVWFLSFFLAFYVLKAYIIASLIYLIKIYLISLNNCAFKTRAPIQE